jgi:hypothetical protein
MKAVAEFLEMEVTRSAVHIHTAEISAQQPEKKTAKLLTCISPFHRCDI